ncbi:MAG TPA: S8 family serine peptidase [Rariglobus sp.]|jgi:hypothetical protein|nr:S8 family serine peptidase [Rariglobus sp.]
MKGKSEIIILFTVGIALILLLLWIHIHPADTPPALTTPASSPVSEPTPVSPDKATEAVITPDDTATVLAQKLNRRFTRADAREHEAVLIFKNDGGYRRFLARAAQTGVDILAQIDPLWVARVHVRAYDTLAAELLAHAADYGGVSANTLVQAPPVPDDRAAHPQVPVRNTLLATVGVTTDNSNWGRGVTIAVLDSGALPDATLGGGRLQYLDIGLGYTGPVDDSMHGTAVAALAAGSSSDARGIAPSAGILSIRVTDTEGKSDAFTVTQAIVAAVDAGAKIINISMGGYSTSEALDRAVAYAEAHGAVVVAAAGNEQASRLAWPAANPRVISVGSVDATGQQVSFSNSGEQLHLTAPGYGIQTAGANGTRILFSGTSASAPVVSGAIAAVMSETPGLTAAQAVQVLQTHADDGGPAGDDPDYGHGVLDLGWAMARNDPTRTDIAISSHAYDTESSTIAVVIQNRGGTTTSGMTLATELDGTAANYTVPSLAPGGIISVNLPLDPARLAREGRIVLRTRLVLPSGFVDQLTANNSRASVLTPPFP